MRNHLFRFKKFSLSDEKSLMKIGTDSVLLSAWCTDNIRQNEPGEILDIGTGCGVIAIMLAIETNAEIDGVEIDTESSEQAINNILLNKLADRIKIINLSFSEFLKTSDKKYDLIITNPPYFKDSLRSKNINKNTWRHSDTLNYENILSGFKKLLSKEGALFLILPYNELENFTQTAYYQQLYLNNSLKIISKIDKPANRILLKLSQNKELNIKKETLTIRERDNSFTDEYKLLVKDYYINL